MKTRAWTFLAFLLGTAPAHAHDKWIDALPFRAASPAPVKLYLVTGEALRDEELRPLRRSAQITRLALHHNAEKQDLRPLIEEDVQPLLTVPLEQLPLGTSVLQLDTASVDIELPAAKFESYLFEERLFEVLAARARLGQEESPGKERYSRCLKALLQVGEKPDASVTQPIGQELELVPLQNPYGLRIPGKLTMQVLLRGQPLKGHALGLAARRHSAISSQTLRTDQSGKATFTISQAGDFLFTLVHMEEATAQIKPAADWRSYWGSLSFSLAD